MPKPPDELRSIPQEADTPPQEYVELVFDSRVKRAIASAIRLGRGKPGTTALLELGDNIFDWAITDPEQTTMAVFHLPSWNPRDLTFDRVRVESSFEQGMDAEKLRMMLKIGKSEDKGSGSFGIGAQAALMGLGKDVELTTKAKGSKFEYRFNEPGYGDYEVAYEGKRPISTQKVDDVDVGRVDIIIKRLRLNEGEIPTKAELVRAIAERYRPRIAPERLKFDRRKTYPVAPRRMIDQTGAPIELHDQTIVFVSGSKKTEQVVPFDYHLDPQYSEALRVAKTVEGEVVPFWVGEKAAEAKQVDTGLRYYISGVLIHKGGLAGHDEKDTRLSRVVGEVHADHVRGFKDEVLSLSKSATKINTDAAPWIRLERAVGDAINPFISGLLTRETEKDQFLPPSVIKAIQDGKRLADSVIGELLSSEILSGGEIPLKDRVVVRGQKVPQSRQREGGLTGDSLGVLGKLWEEQQAKTTLPKDADSAVRRKRVGAIADEIKLIAFEDGDNRQYLVRKEENQKIMMVNTGHDALKWILTVGQISQEQGALAMKGYIAEQLITEATVRYGGKDVEDFLSQLMEGKQAVWQLVRQDQAAKQILDQQKVASSAGKKKK